MRTAIQEGLIYDAAAYVSSLSHVGSALPVDGLNLNLLVRPIGGTGFLDITGPIPYSQSLATVDPGRLRTWLDGTPFVTFLGALPPNGLGDPRPWQSAGFDVWPFKTCYMHVPDGEPIDYSARTRRNLRLAARHWQVGEVELEAHREDAVRWYGNVVARGHVHPLLRYPPSHFKTLARMNQVKALGGRDGEGLGTLLVYGETSTEIHCHLALGAPRAYRTAGFYALFTALLERFGSRKRILWTGAPQRNPSGLGRFKRRFSNATSEMHLVFAVLRPGLEAKLCGCLGRFDWFPAYRDPNA